MGKQELEFFDPKDLPWRQVGGIEGLNECILSEDPADGSITRIFRFDPGVSSASVGQQIHDFWEEVYILEGSIHDLTLDKTFSQGCYACRPPGMIHGPWKSENGALLYEVRYYK